MSMTMHFANHAHEMASVMPQADVFDTFNQKAAKATSSVKVAGGLLGTIIVLVIGFKSRGALGALVSGIVFAALYVWAVSSIGGGKFNSDVNETFDSGMGTAHHQTTPHAAGDRLGGVRGLS